VLVSFLLFRAGSRRTASRPAAAHSLGRSVPPLQVIMYAEMTDKQREVNRLLMGETDNDGKKSSISSLNNMLMQMRKNCNHPDLVTAAGDGSFLYPPADQLVAECGKMQLLVRCTL